MFHYYLLVFWLKYLSKSSRTLKMAFFISLVVKKPRFSPLNCYTVWCTAPSNAVRYAPIFCLDSYKIYSFLIIRFLLPKYLIVCGIFLFFSKNKKILFYFKEFRKNIDYAKCIKIN